LPPVARAEFGLGAGAGHAEAGAERGAWPRSRTGRNWGAAVSLV